MVVFKNKFISGTSILYFVKEASFLDLIEFRKKHKKSWRIEITHGNQKFTYNIEKFRKFLRKKLKKDLIKVIK